MESSFLSPSPPRMPVRPGLRLGTIALWIAGCAASFAFYANLAYPVQPQFQLLSLAYNMAMGTVVGSTLTGLVLVRARKTRGDATAFAYPGHWLLVLGGAAIVIDVLFASTLSSSGPTGARDAYWVVIRQAFAPRIDVVAHQAITWGFGMVAAGAVLFFAWHRLTWVWRGLFLAFALLAAYLTTTAIVALLRSPMAIIRWSAQRPHATALVLLCGVVLLVLAGARPSRYRSADALHWLGVGVVLATAVIQLILYKSFF